MRIPVVATRLGGMAELVEHDRSGLLFELDDAADLTHQLKRFFTETDLSSRLQEGIPPVRTIDDEMNELVQPEKFTRFCPGVVIGFQCLKLMSWNKH